jgi:SET domain-containing protein
MKEIKVLDKSYYKVKRGISGFGLFAEKDIKKGDWIIEYIGIVIRIHLSKINIGQRCLVYGRVNCSMV